MALCNKIIAYTFLLFVLTTVNASRTLSNNDSDPTSRELLGRLCERRIGTLFKRCDESSPPSKGSMGKGEEKEGKGKEKEGKGKRRRTRQGTDNAKADLLMFVDSLSSDDKTRLLTASEEGDEDTVNMIVRENDVSGRTLLGKLCERRIGGLFKRCDESAPVPKGKGEDKGGKGKEKEGKGKRELHRGTREGGAKDDLVMFIDNLSSDDKKRLLNAIENKDEAAVDAIFDRYN